MPNRSDYPQTQLFLSYLGENMMPKRLNPTDNRYGQYMLKPGGGIWTSTFIPPNSSAFARFASARDHEHWIENATRFVAEPLPDLRVLIIDTAAQFIELVRPEYRRGIVLRRYDSTNMRSRVVANMLCRRESPIDWPLVMQDWDAIWARGFIPPSWSCESIFWAAWHFASIEKVKAHG